MRIERMDAAGRSAHLDHEHAALHSLSGFCADGERSAYLLGPAHVCVSTAAKIVVIWIFESIPAACKSWLSTSAASSACGVDREVGMDDTTRELIAGLCVRAGTLMEDTSTELVSSLADDPAIIWARIDMLDQAAQDLAAFAAAARSLLRLAAGKN
jgi:hypothetical protein